MTRQVLVKNSEKYAGKYVATKSFTDKNVITCGKSLIEVYKIALRKGVKDPVVFYVPKKGMVHLY